MGRDWPIKPSIRHLGQSLTVFDRPGCHIGLCCASFPRTGMRRILSSFLLGVLAWSFVAPLALALTTNTPALCCRRNGKHQCISSGLAASDQQAALRTVPSCCPYRSQIAMQGAVARLEPSKATTHLAPSAFLPAQPDSLVAGSCAHSRITQRGPPLHL
jgi:hypothetical protein